MFAGRVIATSSRSRRRICASFPNNLTHQRAFQKTTVNRYAVPSETEQSKRAFRYRPSFNLNDSEATSTRTTDNDWKPFGKPVEQSQRQQSNQPSFHEEQEPDFDPFDAKQLAMEKKRKLQRQHQYEKWLRRKSRKVEQKDVFLPEGSNEEILDYEVAELLAKANISNSHGEQASESSDEAGSEKEPTQSLSRPRFTEPAELKQEVELEIVELSSTGDGLAYNEAKDHVFVIPFSVPGDRVVAKPWLWKGAYTTSDFIRVVRPSPSREGVTPQCKYFAKCGGCQLQMLPYHAQLDHKRTIVQKAYEAFSGMKPEQIPDIQPTFASPLQYGYRTKLSPHFTPPAKFGKNNKKWDGVPPIGFNDKNTGKVLDIEECPLGTDILQEGLTIERKRVAETIDTYKRGATILLRESTQRTLPGTSKDAAGQQDQATPSDPRELTLQSQELTHDASGRPSIQYMYDTHTDTKTYTSKEKSEACEYITTTIDSTTKPPTTKTYKFTNMASSFFQNNNSILGPFTSYIYDQCLPKPQPESSTAPPKIKYLLDAYSGSGLFTLTLSTHFTSSLGIDIDPNSITAARKNAAANNVPNAGFIDADASALFADVPYPAHETVLVVDPPRKGCDREFLKQLRRFGAGRVIYVSCNVHTQARDVGILVNGFQGRDAEWEESGLWTYEVESLRGFDFFPQTGHVEGVCVLNRIGKSETPAAEDGPVKSSAEFYRVFA